MRLRFGKALGTTLLGVQRLVDLSSVRCGNLAATIPSLGLTQPNDECALPSG
eukprot:SAG31_NODE_22695_length_520_cov_0.567696_2_plen_51_part_01